MGGKNFTYIDPAGIAFANKQLTRDVDLFTARQLQIWRPGGCQVLSSFRRQPAAPGKCFLFGQPTSEVWVNRVVLTACR
jgi:hypothetical protein